MAHLGELVQSGEVNHLTYVSHSVYNILSAMSSQVKGILRFLKRFFTYNQPLSVKHDNAKENVIKFPLTIRHPNFIGN